MGVALACALAVVVVVAATINAALRLTRTAILLMVLAFLVVPPPLVVALVRYARAQVQYERTDCLARGGVVVERSGRYVGCADAVYR